MLKRGRKRGRPRKIEKASPEQTKTQSEEMVEVYEHGESDDEKKCKQEEEEALDKVQKVEDEIIEGQKEKSVQCKTEMKDPDKFENEIETSKNEGEVNEEMEKTQEFTIEAKEEIQEDVEQSDKEEIHEDVEGSGRQEKESDKAKLQEDAEGSGRPEKERESDKEEVGIILRRRSKRKSRTPVKKC